MKELISLFSYPKRKLRKLASEGDYKEALEFGKSIESKYSKDTDFLFIMGSIYYILEDAKNTLYYLDKALEIEEYDEEALLMKANVHLYLKEHKDAFRCCDKIFEIDPKNKAAQEIFDKLDDENIG